MTAKKAGQEAPNSAYQDAKPTSTPKNRQAAKVKAASKQAETVAAKIPQSVLQKAKTFAGKNKAALIASGIGAGALSTAIPLTYVTGKAKGRNESQG